MPDAPASRRRWNPRFWLAALAMIYLTGAVATALSERPWCDEGWFAEPAWNLVRLGEMSTPTLDTSLEPALSSLKRYTYWVFPTYLVALGGWSWVFGFTLFSARMFSTFWGAVLLASAAIILRKLNVRWRWVFLALALVLVDYQFLRRAAEVRMDIMCAALGFASIAFYHVRRETHHLQAMVGSHALCAVGVLTHPLGVLAYVSLLFTQFYFDRERITFGKLALAATPYLLGMALWAPYILQSPDDFWAQLGDNARGRGSFWSDPVGGVLKELQQRYLLHIGGIGAGAEAFKALKAIPLVTLAAGMLGAALAPRTAGEPAGLARYLGGIALIHGLLLMIIDGPKYNHYAIHILPWYYLLATIGAVRIAQRGGWRRAAVGAWLGAHFLIQAAGAAYPVYRHSAGPYMAAVRFIEPYLGEGRVVMGSAELGFEIGFGGNLVDDWTLGCVNGIEPTIIVEEKGYRERQDNWRSKCEDHIRRTLAPGGDYELAMEQGEFSVYLRRGLRRSSASELH